MLKNAMIIATSISLGMVSASSFDMSPNRDSLWQQKYGNKPTHWVQEKDREAHKSFIANYKSVSNRAKPTDPRSCAEFEPVEAVAIAYPGEFGFSLNLLEELTKSVKVLVLAPSSNHNSIKSQLQNANVEMDSIEFISVTKSDSYWTRDYGPWCIAEGEEKISIVDFTYNRSYRPNDNKAPGIIGQTLNMDVYLMDLIQCGGNWMSSGVGEAVSTDLVTDENPQKSVNEIKSITKEYLGIDNYHITKDPLGEYIKHVDCWGKFLGQDKILIGDVTGSKKAAYDEVADYFANTISPLGTPYKVYRVFTAGEPYTNSTIVNNKVFVPIMGNGNSNDEAALEVYREAMPGYEIIGIRNTSSNPWQGTDALHCRTKGITERDLLYIKHIPLHDTVNSDNGSITLNLDLIDYGKKQIDLEASKVVYTVGDSEELQNATIEVDGDEYTATLKAGLDNYEEITYHIVAQNSEGKTAKYPYMGSSDPITFTLYTDDVSVIQTNKASVGGLNIVSKGTSFSFEAYESGKLELFSVNGALLIDESLSAFETHRLQTGTVGSQMVLYRFTPLSGNKISQGRVLLR